MIRRILKLRVPMMVARPLQRSIWDFPRDLSRFFRECERFFEASDSFFKTQPFMETTETVETRGHLFRIIIDMSGFKAKEITVNLKGRVLTVDAKAEHNSNDGRNSLSLSKQTSRLFTIPPNVEVDCLKSLLTNDGILAIEAPFSSAAGKEPKEIPINRIFKK